MKTIRPLLFLGALTLLIAWLMWPDQNQPDSPALGESGDLVEEELLPATLKPMQSSAPTRTQETIPSRELEPLVPPASTQPRNPEDETGRVSVRIVDSFGTPIHHGEVMVLHHRKVLQTLTMDSVDGLFYCELPASEPYAFMVNPDSLEGGLLPQLMRSRSTQNENFQKDSTGMEFFAKTLVLLKPNDDLSIELIVGAPASAYGRVLGPNWEPLEGVMVVLSGLDPRAGDLSESSMTNQTGEFTFQEVFPGNYRQTLHVAPGKIPEGENWNPPAPRDVEILPGQEMDLGDARIGGGQCSVSGSIVNQDGNPFAGLPVLCYSNQKVEEGLDPHTFVSELGKAITDTNGNFTISGLEAGRVSISLTPEFNPRFVLGAGHPAMWEPNVEVELESDGTHMDLGELLVEESRPFLLNGNLVFDDAWLVSNGHRKEDLRVYVSQAKGESLAVGVRRNPVNKLRLPIDWDTSSYQGAIETPMTLLTLTFKLKGYAELNFSIQPEALQTWTQSIQIPSDFKASD